jgi:hypothetical protein
VTTGSDDSVDKTALIVKISEANAAKYSVIIAANAGQAPLGSKWAAQAQVDALQAAITAAENAATPDQAAVVAATAALNAAITAFNNAVSANGLGSQSTGFTQAQFEALKAIAAATKTGVLASADGKDVPATSFWVTQAVMNTFDAAITAANGVTTFTDAAYQALFSALNTFNKAKQFGSKSNSEGGSSGAITFAGIASQYDGQYAIFRSSSNTPPTGGGDTLIDNMKCLP